MPLIKLKDGPAENATDWTGFCPNRRVAGRITRKMAEVQVETALFTTAAPWSVRVCRDSGQTEPKMPLSRTGAGRTFGSVSTGGTESHRLQAGIT